MKSPNFKKGIKKYFFNRALLLFLVGIFCYSVLFALCLYYFNYGDVAWFYILSFIVFSIIPLFVFYKPKVLVLPIFILGFIFSIFVTNPITNFLDIARMRSLAQADLPTYGNYILWADNGGFGSGSAEFYLVNMKKNDPIIMDKLKREFGLQYEQYTLYSRHVVDDYYLLSIHYHF